MNLEFDTSGVHLVNFKGDKLLLGLYNLDSSIPFLIIRGDLEETGDLFII